MIISENKKNTNVICYLSNEESAKYRIYCRPDGTYDAGNKGALVSFAFLHVHRADMVFLCLMPTDRLEQAACAGMSEGQSYPYKLLLTNAEEESDVRDDSTDSRDGGCGAETALDPSMQCEADDMADCEADDCLKTL